jgi:steroid 5-alpha reductase family enzyme
MKDFYTNPRFVIAAVLIVAWAIRLSLNFARRGGYVFSLKKGFTGEDYRWEIMRNKIPNRVLFELFNLVFISAFQLVLVFMITLPMYFLGQYDAPLAWLDFVLFGLHILFLTLETIADNQQFRFHTEKKQAEFANSKRHQLGFNTFGLWKISRHPNYSFEMSQWVVVAFYAMAAMGHFHWSAIGVIVLIFLFVGSTNLTENITKSKYPRFEEWRKASSAWMPFFGACKQAKNRQAFMKSIID